MDEPNLDKSGASEEAEELELELEPGASDEGLTPEPGGDPLDDIQDETARAEAKKARAILRRQKPDEAKPVPTPAPTEFLTRADFYKANERKAIREITADAEIKAVWNEVVPFYTPRRGKETPEDIKEDILDAITIYKTRNPVAVTDDSARELTATPVVKTGGGVPTKATPAPALSNFKLPTQPSDWYAKK